MKMAAGCGRSSSAAGAVLSHTVSLSSTPQHAALRAIRAARSGCRSTAVTVKVLFARSHSMPTEPEPAPTSHKRSPARGASAESVSARIGAFVTCPSCSNQSSGLPGVNGDGVEVGRIRDLEGGGGGCTNSLTRATHRLADMEA